MGLFLQMDFSQDKDSVLFLAAALLRLVAVIV